MKPLLRILALGCAFAAGYLFALSRQSGVPIVFNTQSPLWALSPKIQPIIEMTDTETIVIHRPPEKWFTISCLEWGQTYVRPNYSAKSCWPSLDGKLIDSKNWPDYGKVKCEWERAQ